MSYYPVGRQRGSLARGVFLVGGLAAAAAGVVVTARADLGLPPWQVLHDGIDRLTPLSFGAANVVVGIGVLLLARLLGASFGVGTIANALLVGVFVDLFDGLIGDRAGHGAAFDRSLLLIAGTALLAFGTALYLSAGCGGGPRDSLMVALRRYVRWPLGSIRTGMEVVVLGLGLALGGRVGIGTAIYALSIGLGLTLALRLLGVAGRASRQLTDRPEGNLPTGRLTHERESSIVAAPLCPNGGGRAMAYVSTRRGGG